MSFTQIIEVEGVTDEDALVDHLQGWDARESGSAPGYLRSRLFADEDRDGRYLIEVDFSSKDDAERNSDRQETAEWAAGLAKLAGGEPRYHNLRQVVTTRS